MAGGPGARFENISFSNLIMNRVTGPISIGVRDRSQTGTALTGQQTAAAVAPTGPPGVARNISFRGIRATVVNPEPIADISIPTSPRPGEMHSCIDLNALGTAVLENITFDDVQITFPGGGTAQEAALRDVPRVAGEYFEIGVLPAYALYARNVRVLSLSNVRFGVSEPDLRPAIVFDHVSDAAINGFGAEGNADAESLLRFIDTRDVLLSASRVLSPANVFLQVEGAESGNLTVDGGDLSKAGNPLTFGSGAEEKSVKLRT